MERKKKEKKKSLSGSMAKNEASEEIQCVIGALTASPGELFVQELRCRPGG